jgi:hypothetical protein
MPPKLNWLLKVAVACAALATSLLRAAETPGPKAWKFAVFCDTRGRKAPGEQTEMGVRTSVLGPMAAAIAADGVELVIVPGDTVNGSLIHGTLEEQLLQWRRTVAPLYKAGIPVYAVRGNHECHIKANLAEWREAMKDLPQDGPPGEEGLTYKVDHRNARFIGFDNYIGGRVPSRHTMNPWVLRQIRGNSLTWTFVFAHEPLATIYHEDTMAADPASRDALLNALGRKHGAYFCGHDHMYVRSTLTDVLGDPVEMVLVGDGGAELYGRPEKPRKPPTDDVVPRIQFYNGKQKKGAIRNTGAYPAHFGYLLVTVDGNRAECQWKAFTNFDMKAWKPIGAPVFRTLDRFELTAPATSPAPVPKKQTREPVLK